MREQDLPVIEVYAQALAERVEAEGNLAAIFEEARALRGVFEAEPRLLRYLQRPAEEDTSKKELVKRVFKGKCSDLMLNFGLILVDKHRAGLWDDILSRFVVWCEEQKGLFPARVETAHHVDDAQRTELQQTLEKFTGHRLHIKWVEHSDLLGGVLFRCRDTLVDQTLRGRLDEIAEKLQTVKIA